MLLLMCICVDFSMCLVGCSDMFILFRWKCVLYVCVFSGILLSC